MKLVIVVSLFLLVLKVNAQEIEKERMERDLIVAETVLLSLFENSTIGFQQRADKPFSARYLSGYGVILSVPLQLPTVQVLNSHQINKGNYFATPDSNTLMEGEIKEWESGEITPNQWIFPDSSILFLDSTNKKPSDGFKIKAVEFLLDYGNLISQLSETDKIMIVEKQSFLRGNQVAIRPKIYGSNVKTRNAEISKKDLDAYVQGELSREEAAAKIVFSEEKVGSGLEKDIVLLTNIFERLYKPDISKTYYAHRSPFAHRIANFGAVVQLDLFSSIKKPGEIYDMPTLGLRDLSQEERDDKVRSLYPLFLNELEENLLNYGKTIRSLEPEELLFLSINLTECSGCDLPNSLEVSIKAGDLREYNLGKISKKTAQSRIRVTELRE